MAFGLPLELGARVPVTKKHNKKNRGLGWSGASAPPCRARSLSAPCSADEFRTRDASALRGVLVHRDGKVTTERGRRRHGWVLARRARPSAAGAGAAARDVGVALYAYANCLVADMRTPQEIGVWAAGCVVLPKSTRHVGRPKARKKRGPSLAHGL